MGKEVTLFREEKNRWQRESRHVCQNHEALKHIFQEEDNRSSLWHRHPVLERIPTSSGGDLLGISLFLSYARDDPNFYWMVTEWESTIVLLTPVLSSCFQGFFFFFKKVSHSQLLIPQSSNTCQCWRLSYHLLSLDSIGFPDVSRLPKFYVSVHVDYYSRIFELY